jgi:hypothetical protein
MKPLSDDAPVPVQSSPVPVQSSSLSIPDFRPLVSYGGTRRRPPPPEEELDESREDVSLFSAVGEVVGEVTIEWVDIISFIESKRREAWRPVK